jgi:hypothetical protein
MLRMDKKVLIIPEELLTRTGRYISTEVINIISNFLLKILLTELRAMSPQ